MCLNSGVGCGKLPLPDAAAKGEVMSNRSRIRYVAVGLLSTGLLCLGSAMAWADDGSIVLDLVRHGQSVDNLAGIIDTEPPGTGLTPVTGEQEASTVAQEIQADFGKDIVPDRTGRVGYALRVSPNHFDDPLTRPCTSLLKWSSIG